MVLGSSATNSMIRGYLYGAVVFFTCSCSSASSSGLAAYPSASTTVAFTTAPRSGSGTPVTAHSSTAGCSMRALSTSKGPIR